MPIDLTIFEPDGLQVHIRLNSLLSEFGFFRDMEAAKKLEFDARVEAIIKDYLPYDENPKDPDESKIDNVA